jgi:hypothetical protein
MGSTHSISFPGRPTHAPRLSPPHPPTASWAPLVSDSAPPATVRTRAPRLGHCRSCRAARAVPCWWEPGPPPQALPRITQLSLTPPSVASPSPPLKGCFHRRRPDFFSPVPCFLLRSDAVPAVPSLASASSCRTNTLGGPPSPKSWPHCRCRSSAR